jgi:sugar phosphate isomerase/epimerase
MVELGILTTEFERSSLEDNLDAVKSHGIGAVQFQLGSALPQVPIRTSLEMGLDALGPLLNRELCREIRRQLAARQITLAAVDGTFNMVGADVARRGRNLRYLERLIELCEDLGTAVVTLCTGSRDEVMWRRHPDNDSGEVFKDLVSTAEKAARVAEEHGVVLAFEPEANNVVDSPEKARRLIDDVGSPAVKVLMDPANIFKEGDLAHMQDTLERAFSLLGKDIALAHAKDLDHDGDAGHLGAGLGKLDYSLYLSLLQKSGFDGVLILHQLRGLDDSQIDSCFSYVRAKAPPGYVR